LFSSVRENGDQRGPLLVAGVGNKVVALAVVKVVLDLRNGGIGGRDSSRAVVHDPLDEQTKAFLLRDAPSVVLVRVVTEQDDVGDASPVPPLSR
jgi:hypothetical protein